MEESNLKPQRINSQKSTPKLEFEEPALNLQPQVNLKKRELDLKPLESDFEKVKRARNKLEVLSDKNILPFIKQLVDKDEVSLSDIREIRSFFEDEFMRINKKRWAAVLLTKLIPHGHFQESIKILAPLAAKQAKEHHAKTIMLQALNLRKAELINILKDHFDFSLQKFNGINAVAYAAKRKDYNSYSILKEIYPDLPHDGIERRYINNFEQSLVESGSVKSKVGNTELLSALKSANISKAFELVASSEDVNAQDIFGNSPLLLAVKLNNLELMQELIKKGADVNIADERGVTILMHAIKLNRKDIVSELLKSDVNINKKDDFGASALHYAAEKYDLGVIEKLLTANADIHAQDKAGFNLVHILAAEPGGGDSKIATIIKKYAPSFYAYNIANQQAVDIARQNGREQIRQYLIDISHLTSKRYASPPNENVVIDEILDMAKEQSLDKTRQSRLLQAAEFAAMRSPDKVNLQKKIQEKNIKTISSTDYSGSEYRDPYGKTLLHLSAQSGDLEILKFDLEEMEYLVNSLDNEGRGPIFDAIDSGNTELVKELVKSGARTDLEDFNGFTAEMYAASKNMTLT